LRPTRPEDLDFVLALERGPENTPFIGQWSREEHEAAIARADREHWIIESSGAAVGYLIAYDLVATGFDVYVKRIVAAEKSRGVGRQALRAFARHAFADLGARSIWLSVFTDNVRAQRAYAALGFRIATMTAEEWAARGAAVGGVSGRNFIMVLDPAEEPRSVTAEPGSATRSGSRRAETRS
jgi:RimJ/RimL family protein N-acetyltransferase